MDRNFALSYQLKEHGCFPPGTNIKELLDLWYQVLCTVYSVLYCTVVPALQYGGQLRGCGRDRRHPR